MTEAGGGVGCAGALAMEKLHRQVLPFILRRMKEDVLNDLPPKIIQDYYCDLSPLQVNTGVRSVAERWSFGSFGFWYPTSVNLSSEGSVTTARFHQCMGL